MDSEEVILTDPSKSNDTSSPTPDEARLNIIGLDTDFLGSTFILTSSSFTTVSFGSSIASTVTSLATCIGSVFGSALAGAAAVSAGFEGIVPASSLVSDDSSRFISVISAGVPKALALSHSSSRGAMRAFMSTLLRFKAGMITDSPNMVRVSLRRSHFVGLFFSNSNTS